MNYQGQFTRAFCLGSMALFLVSCNELQNAAPGETRIDPQGIEQVWVPAGSFLMGTDDVSSLAPPSWAMRELASEQPEHEIRITRGYWIDKYEVTNSAFQAFVAGGGYLTEEYWSEE